MAKKILLTMVSFAVLVIMAGGSGALSSAISGTVYLPAMSLRPV